MLVVHLRQTHPRVDGRFILDTDVSDVVLSQLEDEVNVARSTLFKPERDYCVLR